MILKKQSFKQITKRLAANNNPINVKYMKNNNLVDEQSI